MSSGTTDLFAKEIIDGLTADPKRLPSKYFYDETGDKLFQAIMQAPEYYLTDCEYEIFNTHKQRMLELFSADCDRFDLIEFGAGDGFKTKVLLKHFLAQNANFRYVPIDISSHALEALTLSLQNDFPELQVEGIQDDYFSALEKLPQQTSTKKVVLFLGSNVGNFTAETAQNFYDALAARFQKNDQVVTGFDLMKDPATILAAYNDSAGVTKAFNLNLLNRINKELQADFDITNFSHFPTYNPLTGETRSFLINNKPQTVHFAAINRTVAFDRSEPIFMEVSQKYSLQGIETLASKVGFQIEENLLDCKHWFTDSVWSMRSA